MFLPFEAGEIHSIIEIVYKVIQVGWNPAHNASQQYLEFKRDVETLRKQLRTLERNIGLVEDNGRVKLAPKGQFREIFADFRHTLDECYQFLEKRNRFATQSGPLANIQWALWAKDEMDMHRDRIAVLNLKLNLALQSLQIDSGKGVELLVIELTALLLQKLDGIESRQAETLELLRAHNHEVRVLETSSLSRTTTQRIIRIDARLIDRFKSTTAERYGGLVRIPFSHGINEAIFYLDRATNWIERRNESEALVERQQSQLPPVPWQRRASRQNSIMDEYYSGAFRYSRLYRAYWLLQTIKEGREYQEASRPTMANFERQYPVLGMTVKRFVDKLEESILDAYDKLSQEMATAPMAQQPTVDQLIQAVEKDGDAWRLYCEWAPPEEEDDDVSKMGNCVETCALRSTSTCSNKTVQIWSREPPDGVLTFVIMEPARGPIYRVVLREDRIIPEFTYQNSSWYSLRIHLSGRDDFRLSFPDKGELFIAQQWLTGYKVIDDFERVNVVQQRATWASGERLNIYGRVQIWNSTRAPPGPQLPRQLIDPPSPPNKKDRRESTKSFGSTPLKLLSLPNFSRFSLHFPSESKLQLARPPVPSTSSATPDLTAESTLTARSTSSSSFDKAGDSDDLGSFSLPRRRTTNLIQVDDRGNVGCIIDEPDPPRLVIFVPPESWQPQPQPYGSRRSSAVGGQPEVASLLVIDVDQYVKINPTLCKCHEDDLPASKRTSRLPIIDRNNILHLPPDSEYYGSPPSPSSPTTSPRSPGPVNSLPTPKNQPTDVRCRKVILEVANGASGISARESVWPMGTSGKKATTQRPPGGVVNLAGAGRYQDGYGLGKVAGNMKKLSLKFGSVEERIRFVAHFKNVRDLYIMRYNESKQPVSSDPPKHGRY